jgi:DNA replication protein DnaC
MEQHINQVIANLNQKLELSLKEVADSYSHIDLTEDEELEGIIWAKRNKLYRMEQAELREREEINRRMLTANTWIYQQTKSFMLYRKDKHVAFNGKFEIDEQNKNLFEALCCYFSNDKGFLELASDEKYGLNVNNPSLDKGILLAGNCGIGKTWMMQLFQKNNRQVYIMRNAKLIADLYEKAGQDGFDSENYDNLIENDFNDSGVFFQKYSGLCIDDLGTEDWKAHYANKKNVIRDLIEIRYAKKNMGVYLHGTTNLSVVELGSFYGARVMSRMREMFNFFDLGGEDRRK